MIRRRHPKQAPRHRMQGMSMIEMVVVATVLLILAGVTLPVAKYSIKRGKEMELRLALRTMRNAIDEHKRYVDAGLLPTDLGTDGYPSELEALLDPVDLVGQIDRQIRFLRRIPIDPMTGSNETWILLSTQDDSESQFWGGENVYDVRSGSRGTGLNGIPYREW